VSAFKAYDIRGVYNKDFDKELAYKVGYFLPRLLNSKVVVVGRDIRVSSDEIFENLSKGVNDSGADVWDIGLATTPMVYFATTFFDVGASVQITASHNAAIYNGMKISQKGGLPVGQNSGLLDLEKMVNNDEIVVAKNRGKVIQKEAKESYLNFLKEFATPLENLNLSIDLSHGMANLLAKELLGENHHYLYDQFDGTFPAHEPNPLLEENQKDIIEAVLKNNSDLGIIFDGDADRVMFVDDKGKFIQPDYVTALIGKYFLEKEQGNVLVDIRTSRSTTEYLKSLGANITIWKVGHAFAKIKLREIDGIFGGELAGHYYFRDFSYCDSGFLATLLVLQVVSDLKNEKMTISEFMDSFIKYANSGEINFVLNEKDQAMEALYNKYAIKENPNVVYNFDGYRVEFDTWWFNVRKSNTEPYLRLVAEAETQELLNKKVEEISSIIKSFN